MREIDLIPDSYRRERTQRRWIRLIGGAAACLVATTAAARILAGYAIEDLELEIDTLQARQTITAREREELARLDAERRGYRDQLHLLRGLRSGTAASNLFRIMDEALIGDELWFRSWQFRRAGVTNAEGQPVETGYFIVVADANPQQEAWQVETHMTIAGQALDHTALSEFVRRLLERPEIEDVRIRRTELRRYEARSLVDFDLAVVINRRVLD
jgi:hypothetical protein